MYESGTIRQGELENEILRRLGLYDDATKHATVKRRIYDALSTFIALEIIRKVDKTLHWNGFPQSESSTVSPIPSSSNPDTTSLASLPPPCSEETSLSADTEPPSTDSACTEELQAQITELEAQIKALSQKQAYYSFFNNQTISPSQRDQTSSSPISLPFTVIAVPSEADITVFSNADRTHVAVDANMRNISVLSDDQIVKALIKNKEKNSGQLSPF